LAVAMFGAGVFALYSPAALDDYDKWGFRIVCGSALSADYEQAAIADEEVAEPGDRVDQCRSAIWWRRGWASTLVLVGAGLSIAMLTRAVTTSSPRTQ
jgi:hypothetical protein